MSTSLRAFVFVGVGLPGLISNLIKRALGRGPFVERVLARAAHLGLGGEREGDAETVMRDLNNSLDAMAEDGSIATILERYHVEFR